MAQYNRGQFTIKQEVVAQPISVILPKTGSFENLIERIFLDCIAKGGRSTMDAIAIQLKYPDKITIEARFTTEMLLKVQEDLPLESLH